MTRSAAFAALACSLVLSAPPALSQDDALRARIAHERAELIQMLAGVTAHFGGFASLGAQFSAENLRATFGSAVYIPGGYDQFYAANAVILAQAVGALGEGRPMTLEAIRSFRLAFSESNVREAANLGPALWNLSVYRSALQTGVQPFRDSFGFGAFDYDDDGRIVGTRMFSTSYEQALALTAEQATARAAPLRVEFTLGPVTLDMAQDWDASHEAHVELTALRSEVEASERAVARQEASFEASLQTFTQAAAPVMERLEQGLRAANGDAEAMARERGYADVALRSLAIPHEVIRDALLAARTELATDTAALHAAEERLRHEQFAGFPRVDLIESADARLVPDDDVLDELAQIDDLIADYQRMIQERERARIFLLEELAHAVDAADFANNRLSAAMRSSYVVQAIAQGFVQVLDNAVAARGDPRLFVLNAPVQMLSNLTLDEYNYYDVPTDAQGKPAPGVSLNRIDARTALTTSVATSVARYGVSEPSRVFLSMSEEMFDPVLQRPLWSRMAMGQGRRVVYGQMADMLSNIQSLRARTVWGSILEGALIDTLSELAKQGIADAMQATEVQNYIDAQFRVAAIVQALGRSYQLEDHDEAALARLASERRALEHRLAQRLPGRALMRAALHAERNDPFEAGADTVLRVVLDDPDREFDLLINGVLADPADEAGVFRFGRAVIADLALGARPELELTIALR